jgi:transposase
MTVKLTDDQWQKILPVLKTCRQVRLGAGRDARRFLEAVLWVTRSGAQWRLLPSKYGNWNAVYKRFARWSELKVFEKLFEHFSADATWNICCLIRPSSALMHMLPERKKRGRAKFRP